MSKAKILQLMENGQKCYPKTHVDAIDGFNLMLEGLYPVGSVYLSVSLVDPSTIFGGTWEKMPEGMIWSTDDQEAGQVIEEQPFVLSKKNLPEHTHVFNMDSAPYGASFIGQYSVGENRLRIDNTVPDVDALKFTTDNGETGGVSFGGRSEETEIMSYPERFTVHAWYRIA